MRDEFQHRSVDAVTLVRRGIKIFPFEYVAEVAIANLAEHFGPGVAEMKVGAIFDVLRLGRIVERGPTAFGIEFLV